MTNIRTEFWEFIERCSSGEGFFEVCYSELELASFYRKIGDLPPDISLAVCKKKKKENKGKKWIYLFFLNIPSQKRSIPRRLTDFKF